MPYDANKNELEVLNFWEKNKTFEKSVESRPENKPYVFYDGPPFATGLPHYGHIVASLMKDVVPRYWTMKGRRVERVWGWDCHGLPVENIIEEKLGLKTKQDIEKMGIAKFCDACRSTVLQYAEEWKKTIHRMGRWVDMDHAYKTMDLSYMESIWWVFKQLWDKDLIYEGKKSMHICPRCATPLSNFEVTQGYKDVKDLSAMAKFKIKRLRDCKIKLPDGDVYILAWTTTPWTLPGNVLLAVGKNIKYVLVEFPSELKVYDEKKDTKEIKKYIKELNTRNNKEYYIVAKNCLQRVFSKECIDWGTKEFENKFIKAEFKGSDLIGLEYEPLFPYFADTANAFRVVEGGDFVTTEEGTGVVHIAPAFGEDDYQVGLREKTGWVQHVTMEGKFTHEVTDFAGQEVKPKDDPTKMDVEMIKYLANKGLLFSKEKYEHSYPHCWRCDTPLLNYSTSSWFVKVTELKSDLLKNNEKISWVPEHIKEGRFGLWLEGARDWAISRNRYWGTPLPVWRCGEEECRHIVVVGSVEELEKLSGQKIADLHKNVVDDVAFKCEKCGGKMKRITEVLDCWFESGSMPYAQFHYPFENKEKVEAGFPAEFIAEGQDQTRGWFYTLHVLATALTRGKKPSLPVKKMSSSFKNVIVNGIVLAEDGKKMSKRLKNYPDPMEVLAKYGADAMRYYLVTSPVMYGENLNFAEKEVREMYNKVVNTLWNVMEFYSMFAESVTGKGESGTSKNILDKWILAKLNILIKEVTEKMEEYKLAEASRPIVDFISDLSTWYVRRSRDRFKGDDEKDKQNALATLREVLLTLSKVMAPFTPFIAESIYYKVTGDKESVHLQMWPEYDKKAISDTVISDMTMARKIVEMGHALRKEAGIAVRQPLARLTTYNLQLTDELKQIIAEELNVKVISDKVMGDNFVVKEDGEIKVALDLEITDDLKKEGLVREIVRAINGMRKEQKLTIEDRVIVEYHTDDQELKQVFDEYGEEIKKGVLAVELKIGKGGQSVEVSGKAVLVKIAKN
jgi:isoleucyl-tRNA synthetase